MQINPAELTRKLREKSIACGFELFGVAPVEEVRELKLFESWLDAGYAADMDYLNRQRGKRADPRFLVEDARSIIVCGMNYQTKFPLSVETAAEETGWISRYAWGDDYHEILKKRIQRLLEYLFKMTAGKANGRYYVDTGPVLEKVWAKYAGIGWIGKNTCLINQATGSFIFLAVIITDIELACSSPPPDRCGTCRRCLDACPTKAIFAPYLLDANLCISYLTIEKKGPIPENLRARMGRHVFGCDICQDVCPWNRKAPVTHEPGFQPRKGAVNPDLKELLQLDQNAFREKFKKSPVKRAKWTGILRNTLIAAGNSKAKNLKPEVAAYLQHEDETLREHARWAYERLL